MLPDSRFPDTLRSIYNSKDGVSALGVKTHKLASVRAALANSTVRDTEASDLFIGAHSIVTVLDAKDPRSTTAFEIADIPHITLNPKSASIEFKMEEFPDEIDCLGVQPNDVASVTIEFASGIDFCKFRHIWERTTPPRRLFPNLVSPACLSSSDPAPAPHNAVPSQRPQA